MVITIGWVTWGYFKMRPSGKVISQTDRLVHYHTWAYAHLAYSDVVWLYKEHHLFNHALPYIHVPIQYPVVMGVYMWLAAWFGGVSGYFLASSIGLGACAVGTLLILRRIVPRYYYLFALTPLLLVYSLLNWDLLGIFLMVAGWYAYRRNKYVLSGIMFSLGVFAKLFPVFLLFFACLELWRDGKRKNAKILFVWFAGTSLVINLPFAVANPVNWGEFYGHNTVRSGTSGLLLKLRLTAHLGVAGTDAASFLVVAAALVIFTVLAYSHRLPVASGAAGLFTVFLLVNKVYSPQYTLWILVFAIIAEWPAWTAWLLAAGGLIDYYNSFTVLFLASDHSPSFSWYFRYIFPLGSDARYAALIATLAVGIRQRITPSEYFSNPLPLPHTDQLKPASGEADTQAGSEEPVLNTPNVEQTSDITAASSLAPHDRSDGTGTTTTDTGRTVISANL